MLVEREESQEVVGQISNLGQAALSSTYKRAKNE